MMNFTNKKILVTGASSGIGREICIHLSELGARVVLVARNKEKLQETLSLMGGDGHECFSYDLEDVENIKELVKKCVDYDGVKFDGFVHSAGVPAVYPLKILDYEKFEKTAKLTTYSYLEIIKYLSKKQYSNDGSSIVFISSVLTKIPKKAQSVYVATKAASANTAKVLSLELQRRATRINNILVGDVATQMVENTQIYRQLKDDSKEQSQCLFPVFKSLNPREVSNMALFLLSDDARYIIGEDYYIDGGYFK